MQFAVFSYHTLVHSSTSFSSTFLTFGEEALMPADIVFSNPKLNSEKFALSSASSLTAVSKVKAGALQPILHYFIIILDFIDVVRLNLCQFNVLEKTAIIFAQFR